MKTLSGWRASQDADELQRLIDLFVVSGVRSYLEIGARHGDTFYQVVRCLPGGARAVAVDLPGGAWGTSTSAAPLELAVGKLRTYGYDAQMILGDSTSQEIIDQVRGFGPFDAVLIDGDHRYEGVAADWRNYGELGRMVAFHDIAGEGQLQKTSRLPVEVPRLWRELKAQGLRVEEIVSSGSTMGIGVIYR
jgi:predicted O-methyltransferase YrrM